VGWFGPDFRITIHPFEFTADTKSILLAAGTLVPALYCFAAYPECRSSLFKFNAGWKVYLFAIAAGLILPFTSFVGSHPIEFPWGRVAAINLAGTFIANLFMMPLWEEIVWRGCFLSKVRSFSSPSSGILLMAIGFTVWHGGKIAILYNGGTPMELLSILPLIYFFVGIMLGSVFEMGRGSLWPCVLLHALFNASTDVYYESNRQSSEFASYVSELIFLAIAATIFFVVAIRRRQFSRVPTRTSPRAAA
jgi:membrane protease YdiL (CAAX protease family)